MTWELETGFYESDYWKWLNSLDIVPMVPMFEEAYAEGAHDQLRKVVKLLQEKGTFRHVCYGVEPETGKSLKMLEIELYLEDWEALLAEALR